MSRKSTAATTEATGARWGPVRYHQIAARTVVVLIMLGMVILLVILPFVARAMPAPNEVIRDHYGINVIDNPEFAGDTFLKVGADHLAYVCDRPSRGDILESKEMKCVLP
jgi:hypothetical protein